MLQLRVRRFIVAPCLCACLLAGAQDSGAKVKTNPHTKSKHDEDDKKAPPAAGSTSSTEGKSADSKEQTAYAFGLPTMDGKNLPLSEYKGKVLLVVNLGRQSTYAAQLPALQKLSETFKDKGLVVLGVPSNDFGNAEPGTPADVAKYYAGAKVNFPVMQLSSLSGVHELPLFSYLSKNKAVENDGLHWNYTKFLVDRTGKVILCFPPDVAPDSLAMLATVQEVLDGTWKPKKAEGHDKAPTEDDDDE